MRCESGSEDSQLPKKLLREFADTRRIDQASMIGATDADDFRCRRDSPPNFTDLAEMKKGLFVGLENKNRTEMLASGCVGIDDFVKSPHECLHMRHVLFVRGEGFRGGVLTLNRFRSILGCFYSFLLVYYRVRHRLPREV
jgi:hypothetical protein